jgi:peptide/nickel transport system substrate-binding protein
MKRSETTWRFGVLASLVVLAVAALGAGAGQSASSGSAQAGIIVTGTTDAITNIDPAGNYDYPSFAADIMIYEHLLDFKTGARLQPSLATRCFAVNGNLRRWRCNLRRGVEFHDGSAFDSADVKHSFDRVVRINDPSGISSLLGNLRSTQTNGRFAVTFNLKTPQSTWPLILSTGAGFIVPSTYPGNRLQPNNQEHIGTGPYRLTRYTAGQQAVFERFDDYWGPAARNEGVISRQFARSSTMKLALERGEIDMSFSSGALPPAELDSLKKNRNIRVHQGVGVSIRYLNFNVVRPPFNNVAVRRAIAYLMPRQTIASRVYRGYVRPLYSMPPAGMPGHIDAFATVYGRRPNVAAARRVMQQAGIQTPLAVDIWYTPTRYGDASADEYAEIKRALDSSGLFRVTLKTSEWASYSDVLGRQYNAFQLGWFPDYVDVENYVVPFYRSDTFLATGYKNPTMDRLIRTSLATRNEAARLRIYRQIQLLAARDASTIPYWQGDMIAPARRNIVGIPGTLDAAFIMRFWQLRKR